MTLKAQITAEEFAELPEALQEKYEENGDGYRLQVEGVEFPDDVEKLRNALEREKEERRKAKERLSSLPEDFDPDKWKELRELEEQVEAGKLDEKGREQLEKMKQQIEERKNQEVEAERKNRERAETHLEKLLVQDRVRSAVEEAGIKGEYRDDVVDLLIYRGQPTVEIGDDGPRAYVSADPEQPDVREWVLAWAKGEEGQRYMPPSEKSGGGTQQGGAPGANGANPWSAEHWNITEQGRITRQDPKLAERLKTTAGAA